MNLIEAVQFNGTSVWVPDPESIYSKMLWAPELHLIDGKWYIYVAACDGDNANHRMIVLESNKPNGPFTVLTPIKQKGGKIVYAWAFQGDCDPAKIVSNTFPGGRKRWLSLKNCLKKSFWPMRKATSGIVCNSLPV